MDKMMIVFKWEIKKIFDNWQKAMAVILLPAAIMMLALNLFPVLINYLTTGSLNQRPIKVINAPDSFIEYTEDTEGTTVYGYEFIDLQDFLDDFSEDDKYEEMLKEGNIFLFFDAANEEMDFDRAVYDHYLELSRGIEDTPTGAFAYIGYDKDLITVETKVFQFEDAVMNDYIDSLKDYVGEEFGELNGDVFDVDGFNPVTKTFDYRSPANTGAARVIPGVLVLLMYYCVYSLACDMFAGDRERGFLRKLLMTPVKPSSIIKGKYMAIITIVSCSAVVTFFFLFLSSWLNRSNDAMSLLPFGMLLTPKQLFILLAVLPFTAYAMTSIAYNIVFALRKTDEIITNLQFPLVLILFDFFINMFRWQRPVWLEYMVPIHGTVAVLRDVFMSQETTGLVLISIISNVLAGLIVYNRTGKKVGFL